MLGTGRPTAIAAGSLAPYVLATPITAVRLATGGIHRASAVAFGPYLIAGMVLAKIAFP
jgi:hypothetical protein